VKLSQPDQDTLRVEMTLKDLSSFAPPTGKTNAVWLTRFQTLSVGDPPDKEEAYRIFYVGAESVNGAAPTFFAGSGNSNSAQGVPGNGCANTLPGAAAGCKLILYPAEVAGGAGSNVTGNKITINVPIQGGFGPDRPIKGDRLYNVTALTFGRNGPEDFYTDIDSTRSFDYLLNTSVCTITGTSGNDTLIGTSGADVICGLEGNDTLKGYGGNDVLLAADGNDKLYGGAGNDTFDGGAGSDTVFYSESPVTSGVTANLATGTSSNAQLGSDTFVLASGLSTVENLTGTRYADSFTGDDGPNQLTGVLGDDTLTGAGGNDILVADGGTDTMSGGDGNDLLEPGTGDDASVAGGAGSDTLSYFDVATGGGIVLDVTAGTVTGGGGTDSFTGMETYVGSPQDDTLTGGSGVDILLGGAGSDHLLGNGGNDTLTGNAGNDSIDGGANHDVVSYLTDPAGITANLGTASVTDGYGATDSLTSIESIFGSNTGGDNLTGTTGKDNGLWGAGGADTLSGLDGNDYLNGGLGTDTGDGGPGSDTCVSVENPTSCEFFAHPAQGDQRSDSARAWAAYRAELRMQAVTRSLGPAQGTGRKPLA
jgi:Ca2+-binding RTX toxin-like protein